MILTVNVPGIPVPQGSMKSYGRGRMVHSNEDNLLPWRASVIAHVKQAMQADGVWPLEGAAEVVVTFELARPKSAPRSRVWPDKKPDLDKLCRAALDALEQAGAIRNDSQVVMVSAAKVYGDPGMTLSLRSLAVAP